MKQYIVQIKTDHITTFMWRSHYRYPHSQTQAPTQKRKENQHDINKSIPTCA